MQARVRATGAHEKGVRGASESVCLIDFPGLECPTLP